MREQRPSDELAKVASAVDGPPTARRSLPIMTKYEFAAVVGLRTMHLSKGARPFVPVPPDLKIAGNMQLREIAVRELREGRLPYIVKRPFPNGVAEYVRACDLDLVAVRHLMRSDAAAQ